MIRKLIKAKKLEIKQDLAFIGHYKAQFRN